ncbi:MAG: hypothetical protein IT204_13765 [Fimbriimonadaceae bacterium]|nr:hypothetical protein [Fimbriimonadaceae bacterium]
MFCWELWNELNCFPEWDKLLPEITAWHREMAGLVRSLDPQGHLISTSFGNAEGAEAVWRLPELDFVQSHVYGSVDLAGEQAPVTRQMADRYDRPHLFGEFGTRFDWLSQLGQRDPQGVHVHNLLWSAVHNGSAGTPLSWCWEYLHDAQVYQRYQQLSRYVAGVRWPAEQFQPLLPRFGYAAGATPAAPRDLVLSCGGGAPVGDRLELDLQDPPTALGRFYLYGRAQPAQQRPRVLVVDLPTPSRLILRIGRVWVRGELEVRLDGRLLLQRSLPAGPPGEGRYARSEWSEEWRIWGVDYDLDVSCDLPAGHHEVALSNAGADGITIDRLTIPACLRGPQQLARGYGLRGRTVALVWLQNREHCLRNVAAQQPVRPAEQLAVTLPGLPSGPCRLEWWDPWSLEPPRRETTTATAAGLVVVVPRLERDVALQVRW